MIYSIIRRCLFLLPPEASHHLTLQALRFIPHWFFRKPTNKPKQLMGLTFPNPVGVAAGLDKNGDYIDALAKLGFGFIEVGTVTPRPQAGNPKPRLFRLPQHQALINRMGFNNKGVDYLVEKLKTRRYQGILGVNIGKNRDTSLEHAADDYCHCLEKVYPYVNYVTVNISSPNTAGLRDLQFGDLLETLLSRLMAKRNELQKQHQQYVPLVFKISPDMSDDELQQIAKQFLQHKIDGIIATNTALSREGVEQHPQAKQQGGLSGKPLKGQASHVLKQLQQHLQGKIPIIAAGGIMSADDVQERLAAGAALVQVYTGLIYQGPGIFFVYP